MTAQRDDVEPLVDPAAIPILTDPLPPVPQRQAAASAAGDARRRTNGGLTASANPWLVPPADPAGSPAPGAVVHYGPGVDWQLVAMLRTQASERLSQTASAGSGHMTRAAQEEAGRHIILDLVETTMADRANTGADRLTISQQEALAQATFDSLFRLGRLQPLVDDDRTENILIYGCDDVWLERTDGTLEPGPPVADSDQELVEFLVFIASRSEVNARTFSESRPSLHLRLDDRSRLAATAWVSTRPQVTIRRHRLVRVTLDDLVARDMLTPLAASFLAAAVRDRRSIVVSGAPGAGKTTLVRALCSEIDEQEQIATIESEYELHLHELRGFVRHWEARPGTGEVGPDGRQAGEYSLDQAVWDSLRFNVQRTIVGEVRGPEVIPMLKSMENGAGSLSTTHAKDAVAAIRKLVTCVMEGGPQYTHAMATSKLAEAVDLVVHVDLRAGRTADGYRRERHVAEIVAVSPGDTHGTYATTHVFRRVADGSATPGVLPDDYRALAEHGFDLTAFTAQQGV